MRHITPTQVLARSAAPRNALCHYRFLSTAMTVDGTCATGFHMTVPARVARLARLAGFCRMYPPSAGSIRENDMCPNRA